MPDRPEPRGPSGSVLGSTEGLGQTEVARLRGRFGFNELPERRPSRLLQFLRHFWGPIPWMVEAAGALALVVQHWDDLVIILVLLLANGVVGFWEEWQAGSAVEALRARLALTARVCRDGRWAVLPARELVPGDLVRLRTGDVVPADVEVRSPGEISVDQSTLTGESLPVPKSAGALVYSSSLVTSGETPATVRATGASTFFGRTAELVQTAHTVSHFQRAVLKIGNYLIVTALALAAVIEAVSLLRGEAELSSLQFVLVLVVAAIPVALPTVLSVTMAVGARRMASRQAVVTRLSAMEELAGMDILCSDKTGTLTQNRLTAGPPYAARGTSAPEVLRAAALASRVDNQDPIDLAILASAPPGAVDTVDVLEFRPFDATVKRTQATVREPTGSVYAVSKGACQVIFALAQVAGPAREEADAAVREFAARGFRTLGVARTRADGTWQFLGILPLFDPVRPDAREVIGQARAMGIGVKILTGDQIAIGQETAKRLGLGATFLPAEALRAERGDRGTGRARWEEADGFAQVFPEDKLAIVERLQEGGHIVGMTGDGVNDAPALKKADVGVAVSGATDVARGSASVVLLTAGLGVLVEAVRESRRIFSRMTSYAIYRVGETVRILLFLSLAILVFDLYPVTAIMIVLIALLNDGAILSIAYDRAEVAPAPTRWEMPSVLLIATVLGVVGVSFSFLLLVLALDVWALPFAVVQTLIYLKLSVAGHFGIFATRTRGAFWSSRPAAILLVAVLGTQTVATLLAVSGLFLPALPIQWVGVVWGFALADLVVFDLAKRFAYSRLQRRAGPGRPAPGTDRRRSESTRTLFYRRRHGAPSTPRAVATAAGAGRRLSGGRASVVPAQRPPHHRSVVAALPARGDPHQWSVFPWGEFERAGAGPPGRRAAFVVERRGRRSVHR